MEILITGCERSGTKMLSEKLGQELNVEFNLENKHTIGAFKYNLELKRWYKYLKEEVPLQYVTKFEKHTLTSEINIEFLEWVKYIFPNIKIYYIIRDGRNVVGSIINREWGHTQTLPVYERSLEDACVQWNTVIDTTWVWAQENCEIIRYEDVCDRVPRTLDNNENAIITAALGKNLIKTQYYIV